MGAQTGKQTSNDADSNHNGQVHRKTGGAGEQHCHGHLADGMGNGTYGTGHPQLVLLQDLPQTDGDEDGQRAAGGGIEDGAEITGEDRTQENPDKQDSGTVLGSQGENGKIPSQY